MNPKAYQEAFARICLAPTLPEDDVAALGGDPARWRLYRNMVRKRFRRTLGECLPRTEALVGPEVFDAMVERFLEEAPPRSRYIRDLVPELEAFWQGVEPAGEEPASLRDLLRYERTVWEVRDLDVTVPREGFGEFDFDAPVALNPCHRTLSVEHRVWDRDAATQAVGETVLVAVARRADDKVGSVVFEPWSRLLFESWSASPEESTTTIVRRLAESGQLTLDAGFVDRLCDVVATWIERGLVLGSVTG